VQPIVNKTYKPLIQRKKRTPIYKFKIRYINLNFGILILKQVLVGSHGKVYLQLMDEHFERRIECSLKKKKKILSLFGSCHVNGVKLV